MKFSKLIASWTAALVVTGFSFTAAAVTPVVKVVPWVPSNPLLPHTTFQGKTITLKGTCDQQGANFQYLWDFGDGSPVVTGTVTDKYVIQATHTYAGAVGTIFTARLTVRDTNTGDSASRPYYVMFLEKNLETEVNVAIDEGLWYLHKTQIRAGDSGNWMSGSSYGDRASLGYTGCTVANINAFEVNGHLESGDTSNPYVETVARGMRYLFSVLTHINIGMQVGGNPDVNGNGIGIIPAGSYPYYQGGMFMDAIVASGTPNAVAATGPANVIGRTYRNIVQDMVDGYSYAQYDSPLYGGWRYSANEFPDNSACQWAAIGMIAAERNWGCTIPLWVKQYNIPWLAYSQAANGSFGYTSSGAIWGPYATTPSGMVQMIMDGIGRGVTGAGYPSWANAESFMRNNFGNTGGATTSVKNYYYGLFSFVKSMLLHNGAGGPIVLLHSESAGVPDIDWYAAEASQGAPTDGVARTLVDDQNAAGYWYGHNYDGSQMKFETAWAIMMLHQTIIDPGRPVAVAKAVPNPCVAGQVVTLDGTDCYHQDATRTIVSWEWDVDSDGIYDATGPSVQATFAAVGSYPIKLRIHDDNALPKYAETIVTVVVDTPPIAPTADANGPYHFCDALSKWFVDGRNSVNPDEGESEIGCSGCPGDTIKEYAWDLDGDNDFNDAYGPTPDIKPFFQANGLGVGGHVISLRVTDDTALNYPSSGLPDQTSTASAAVYVDEDCECISLTATPALKAILLAWDAYPGATYYHVYRSMVSGGPYNFVASTTELGYRDQSPGPLDQTYYYIVRPAELNGDELCQSNEASAEPLRPGPVATCVPVKLSNTGKFYYKLDASSETFGHMQLLLFVRDAATGQIVGSIPPTSIVYLRTGLAAHTERAGAGQVYRYIMCKGSAEIWAEDPLGQASEIIIIP